MRKSEGETNCIVPDVGIQNGDKKIKKGNAKMKNNKNEIIEEIAHILTIDILNNDLMENKVKFRKVATIQRYLSDYKNELIKDLTYFPLYEIL